MKICLRHDLSTHVESAEHLTWNRVLQSNFLPLGQEMASNARGGGRCWSVDLTGTSTRCLSNKQNNTWLLFSCSTRQWDIELNTRREISYFCAPMCYNLYVVRSFWSRTRKHLSAPNSHFEFDYTTQTMFYRLKPTYYNQNMIIYWIR